MIYPILLHTKHRIIETNERTNERKRAKEVEADRIKSSLALSSFNVIHFFDYIKAGSNMKKKERDPGSVSKRFE